MPFQLLARILRKRVYCSRGNKKTVRSPQAALSTALLVPVTIAAHQHKANPETAIRMARHAPTERCGTAFRHIFALRMRSPKMKLQESSYEVRHIEPGMKDSY